MSATTQAAEPLDGKRIHPFASLFPPMSDEEFRAIAEDIKAHGLVEPIVLFDGEVIDGIHRLRACIQAGIEPRYQKWDGEGGTPFQYVWSRNWTRRHLSAGQRAVIALAVEKQFSKEAASRMSPKGRQSRGVEKIPQVTGKARDMAAKLTGVNAHYVQDAKLLAKNNPDLLEQVRLGHLTISSAKRQAKMAQASTAVKATDQTHKVKIEFLGHVLFSERLSKAVATQLHDTLSKLLADNKDVHVRLLGKETGKTQEKNARNALSHMYEGTQTWNPFKGCEFACTYCIASFQKQAKRQKKNCMRCYRYEPHEHPERLDNIPKAEIVFVCGNADISFCKPEFILKIIEAIKRAPKDRLFYIQSKKPSCLKPFLSLFPANVILVTTLETNRDEGYGNVSKAPPPSQRFKQFLDLKYPRKVVTIEPVMDFDVKPFADWIIKIKPVYVWLGLNSKGKQVKLPQPSPEKLKQFAQILVDHGIEVKGKKLDGIKMPPEVKRTQD